MYTFPNFEPVHCSMPRFNCCFLTCIQVSQKVGKVIWYSHLFKNFPQFPVVYTVKVFRIVNEAEAYAFLELSCFFYDPTDVGNVISASSAYSKSSLYIWKFLVHMLKPSLKDFEYYFASVWNEGNCAVVWIFFDNGLSLWLEWKLNFFSPVATGVFSKFSGIFNATLSQHHLLEFEIAHNLLLVASKYRLQWRILYIYLVCHILSDITTDWNGT